MTKQFVAEPENNPKLGTTVKAEIGSTWPLDQSYLFYWECGREDFAKLLRDNLQKRMNHEIRKIREQAYAAGWKDAKAKRQKETWFSEVW